MAAESGVESSSPELLQSPALCLILVPRATSAKPKTFAFPTTRYPPTPFQTYQRNNFKDA